MSEYEEVIEEIVKHGVVVKVNKIVDDNYIPYERKYVGCVVELNFSEHDKPFEDKIAKLEEELLRATKEIRQEKHKRELTEWERQELKQRIAELEREKSEKPVAYVLAKEIDGQHYVTVEDFMSVVNNLQSKAEGV